MMCYINKYIATRDITRLKYLYRKNSCHNKLSIIPNISYSHNYIANALKLHFKFIEVTNIVY